MRRNLKRFLTVAAVVGLMISYLPLAPASPPGTAPFGFFKNMRAVFKSIGAFNANSGGWSSSFSSSTTAFGDNAFSLLGDLAVDGANGFLYAVEINNNRVTKIDARTGVVVGSIGRMTGTTGTCPASGAASGWCTGGASASGTTDGAFNNPYGIAIDTARNLMYVADSQNYRVSKFTLSTGAYIGSIGRTTATSGTCPASGTATVWCTGGTFASGTADGQFAVPQSIAIDIANNVIFVTEVSGFRISKINASTGAFMGAIGYSSATTGTCPSGAAAPGWCTGGTFATSSVDGGWNRPSAIVFDPTDEDLFITDYQIGRVSRVEAVTGAYLGSIGYSSSTTGTCPSGAAANAWCTGGNFGNNAANGFSQPYGITVVPGDALLVTEFTAGGHRVQKRTLSTGAFVGRVGYTSASTGTCPVAGTAKTWCTGGTYVTYNYEGGYASPRGIAYDSTSGFVYIAASSDRISRVVASTGEPAGSIGRRVVAVKSFSPGITGFATSSVDGGFSTVVGAALDKTNKLLYVRDDWRITRINAITGEYMGSVGRLSVPLTGSNCPTSSAASTWCYRGVFTSSSADGGFFSNRGLDVDPAGNAIYAAEGARVVKINATTGAFIGSIGVTSASTGTCPASGAASGWCTGGTFTASSVNGGFNNAYSVAVDATNNRLYVIDTYRVIQINASTGAFIGAIGKTSASSGTCPASGLTTGWCTGGTFTSTVDAGGFWSINDVEVDPVNDVLWVLEGPPNYRVSKFTRSTGAYVGSVGKVSASSGTCPASGVATSWCTGGTGTFGSEDGAFYGPSSIAYDSVGGHLYVSDSQTNKVTKLNSATGAFIGAVGYMSASSGTCVAGAAAQNFCTGGTGASGSTDGSFSTPQGVAYGLGFLYVVDAANYRIQRR